MQKGYQGNQNFPEDPHQYLFYSGAEFFKKSDQTWSKNLVKARPNRYSHSYNSQHPDYIDKSEKTPNFLPNAFFVDEIIRLLFNFLSIRESDIGTASKLFKLLQIIVDCSLIYWFRGICYFNSFPNISKFVSLTQIFRNYRKILFHLIFFKPFWVKNRILEIVACKFIWTYQQEPAHDHDQNWN